MRLDCGFVLILDYQKLSNMLTVAVHVSYFSNLLIAKQLSTATFIFWLVIPQK